MTPRDILEYQIAVPPAQFPLIAHFVKWLTVPEDVKIGPAFMVLEGRRYEDGLAMSYMMQVHDILMLRPVEAMIAANLKFHGEDVRIWISVTKRLALLKFSPIKEK